MNPKEGEGHLLASTDKEENPNQALEESEEYKEGIEAHDWDRALEESLHHTTGRALTQHFQKSEPEEDDKEREAREWEMNLLKKGDQLGEYLSNYKYYNREVKENGADSAICTVRCSYYSRKVPRAILTISPRERSRSSALMETPVASSSLTVRMERARTLWSWARV
jgi:hypothetical protein